MYSINVSTVGIPVLDQWGRTYRVAKPARLCVVKRIIVKQIAGGRGRIYRLLGSFCCVSALLGRTR
jgi:hypothetical protein